MQVECGVLCKRFAPPASGIVGDMQKAHGNQHWLSVTIGVLLLVALGLPMIVLWLGVSVPPTFAFGLAIGILLGVGMEALMAWWRVQPD